jgi:hypothetical protein
MLFCVSVASIPLHDCNAVLYILFTVIYRTIYVATVHIFLAHDCLSTISYCVSVAAAIPFFYMIAIIYILITVPYRTVCKATVHIFLAHDLPYYHIVLCKCGGNHIPFFYMIAIIYILITVPYRTVCKATVHIFLAHDCHITTTLCCVSVAT